MPNNTISHLIADDINERHIDLKYKYWFEVCASAFIFIAAIALTVTNVVVSVTLLTAIVVTRKLRGNVSSRLHGLEVVAFAGAVMLAPSQLGAWCVIFAAASLSGTIQFAHPTRA